MSQQQPRDERRPESVETGFVRRMMTARVPVWLLATAVAVVAIAFSAALIARARSAVPLGPAVGVAEKVEVVITLCNRDVDRKGINPRTAELELEETLRDEGADTANVVVNRHDCPNPPR